jgi:hypothetical protein
VRTERHLQRVTGTQQLRANMAGSGKERPISEATAERRPRLDHLDFQERMITADSLLRYQYYQWVRPKIVPPMPCCLLRQKTKQYQRLQMVAAATRNNTVTKLGRVIRIIHQASIEHVGCPLCPQKRTCSASNSMSALCHKQTFGFFRPRTASKPSQPCARLCANCRLRRPGPTSDQPLTKLIDEAADTDAGRCLATRESS